jgi:hypothetical protein
MNIFERTWKMIQKNPLAAFAAFEGLSFLGGAVFPETSRDLTDALRFKDRQVPAGSTMQNYQTGNFGARSGAPGYRPAQRGVPQYKSVARTGVFGNTSGVLYDIQKGIGSFLAAPIDLGRRFSPWAKSGNVGWNYFTGKNGATWKDVQKAIRTDLGLSEDQAGDIVGNVLGSGASGFLGMDGAGKPKGGRQQIKITHKNFPGYSSQIERMRQARQTQGYGPNQLRAIALAFNDENLRKINRETSDVKRNKQTINLPGSLRILS